MYKDDKDIEDKVTKQMEYIKNQYSDNYEETLKNYGYEDEEGLDMSEADADMGGSEEEEDIIEPNL